MRPRLLLGDAPPTIYAIGDVHGRLDLLLQLERLIATDAASRPGAKLLVMLGDYIDRGPKSAQVLDHLLEPALPGFTRVCLVGNHEVAFLGMLDNPRRLADYLALGGDATLASYGIEVADLTSRRLSGSALKSVFRANIPDEHLTLLRAMPVLLETPRQIFVHAGLRLGTALAAQSELDLTTLRNDDALDYTSLSRTVVHGHIPRAAPVVLSHRIGLDTGAFATGRLTAVRLAIGEPAVFMATDPAPTPPREWDPPPA